jgi:biopolymer transport protein ExbB/TolQ
MNPMTKTAKKLLIAGVALTILPLVVGPILTVVAMASAFHDLSPQGIADPKHLSNCVGLILTATTGGLVVSGIGLVVLLVAGVKIYADSRGTNK